MITYNHEGYIAQALEGIVGQQCDFDFEVLVGEDCSIDRTREICNAYAKKYPDKIRLLVGEKNVGVMRNCIRVVSRARGEYVAFCEGDDYWTDRTKLSMQLHYMEEHPDCSIVCTNSDEYEQSSGRMVDNVVDASLVSRSIDTPLGNFLENGYWFRTATIMTRRQLLMELLGTDIARREWCVFDTLVRLFMALKGRVGYIDKSTSVYRLHQGGISKSFISAMRISFQNRAAQLWVLKQVLANKQLSCSDCSVVVRKMITLLAITYWDPECYEFLKRFCKSRSVVLAGKYRLFFRCLGWAFFRNCYFRYYLRGAIRRYLASLAPTTNSQVTFAGV